MRLEVGFVNSLREELSVAPTQSLVNQPGALSDEELLALVSRPSESFITAVEDVARSEIAAYDAQHLKLGTDAIERNEVAFLVVTGEDPLKATGHGLNTLGVKMMQSCLVNNLTLMIHPRTLGTISEYVNSLSTIVKSIGVFEQYWTYALSPDNRLVEDIALPQLVTSGDGDLFAGLKHSGVLDSFKQQGFKHIVISSVENVLAPLDPSVIGRHIAGEKAATFSVVERKYDHENELLLWIDGQKRIAHLADLPEDYVTSFKRDIDHWHYTGSAVFDVKALEEASSLPSRWIRRRHEKQNRLLTSYERYINQATFWFDCDYVLVSRETHFLHTSSPDFAQEVKKLFMT